MSNIDSNNDKSVTEEVKNTSEGNDLKEKEIGGTEGPDPTRYGDCEKNGRCIDF